jgi:hypothetical protein
MKSKSVSCLFRRIVVLVFLLGLVFGPAGLFIRVYNFIRSGFDPLAPATFGWPLDALQIILGGAFLVLLVTTADLCSQFLMDPQWENGRWVFIRFCEHFSKILGFLLMGGGTVLLLEKPLNLPELKLSSFQELAIDIILILLFAPGIGALSWYLLVRDKRRAIQKEQEEGNLRENRTL